MAGMRQLHTSEQGQMQTGYIDCEDCGHCIDFHTPTDTQPDALTKVQEDIADAVAGWIQQSKDLRTQVAQ